MAELFRLELHHDRGVTPIVVGNGALGAAAEELAEWWRGRTLFVVTSSPVAEHAAAALADLGTDAARVVRLEVPDGEAAKTPQQAERLWAEMLGAGGKRDSCLLAFGGGSVGDLAGFVAATFLRGIDCVQLPTTLLAQVDAAVGGKTGIDLEGMKNAVGVVAQPHLVVADTSLLATLPVAELRAGLVEVVKMAFLLDPPLLDRVEGGLDPLLAGDAEALAPVVAAAVQAKIGVVETDPGEADRRRLLNFGHTLGHAIEAVLGYRDLRHGEAVAYGLLFALRLARRRGLSEGEAARLVRLLERFELPPLPALDPELLLAAMARDKKARESGLVWVLPRALGEGVLTSDVSPEEVARELPRFLAGPFKK